jgi:hypothetical protein
VHQRLWQRRSSSPDMGTMVSDSNEQSGVSLPHGSPMQAEGSLIRMHCSPRGYLVRMIQNLIWIL